MIISASRRTDIPAFYADWFINRVRAGYAEIFNPFNPSQKKSINLNQESVDAVIFWTRNCVPLLRYLDELDSKGYRYIFLYTITGYPRDLEENLPPVKTAIDASRRLSDRIGPGRVIWRYDPIILSSITDEDYHLENFEAIAKALSGYTQRVIISFIDLYKKAERRLKRLEDIMGIRLLDMNWEICNRMASNLREISADNHMRIQSCAEEIDLSEAGIRPGSCIDIEYINEIFNSQIRYKKDPGQREKCLCSQSVDIGAYNTCGYRCIYCYANTNFEKSRKNLKTIDNRNPYLYVENK